MKSSLVIVTVLLLSCWVSSQASPTPSCITDTAQANVNYFLAWLAPLSSGTVLSASAQSTVELCKEDWSQGTCCDATKLKAFFDSKAKGFKNAWGKLISGANKFKGQIKKYTTAVAKKTEVAAALNTANQRRPSKQSPTGLTGEEAAAFLEKLSTYEADLKAFRESSGKECFKSIHPYRGKIWCAGCSAVGYQYFAQGPAFKFNSGTCNSLVEKCAPAWAFIAKLQIYKTLLTELQVAKKNKGTERDSSKAFFGGILPAAVANLINKCPTGKVAADCTQDDLDKYCQANLSFSEPEPVAQDPAIEESPEVDLTDSRRLQTASSVSTSGSGQVVSTGGVPLAASTSLTSTEEPQLSESSALLTRVGLSFLGLLCFLF